MVLLPYFRRHSFNTLSACHARSLDLVVQFRSYQKAHSMRVMVKHLTQTIVSFFSSLRYVLNVPIPVHHESSAMSILIVEDEAMQRDYLTEVLARAGHTITCASNGREAIAAVKSIDFNVVLMDIYMPLMDGLTATRVIRSLGDTTYLPILGMSARDDKNHRQSCRASGMDGHLAKPFNPLTLPATILQSVISLRFQHAKREWLGCLDKFHHC